MGELKPHITLFEGLQMSPELDRANDEVKGISRYIPTVLSKGILLLLPATGWFCFAAVRGHPTWFGMQKLTELEQTLTAALVSITLCILLVIILVLDMAVALHHSKHRRIIHYSNEHPLMSFKFLISNAAVVHWLTFGAIIAICIIAGYGFAKI